MTITPENLLETIREIATSQDWEKLPGLKININQGFIDNNNLEGLVNFYEKLISLCFDRKWIEKIQIKDISSFENSISNSLVTAKETLEENKSIKVVYLEYFYDGGDSCDANLFLCNSYTEENDYWASEFDDSGFIEGPKVNEYLDYDPEFELDATQEIIANIYVDALLLAAAVTAWKNSGITGYPFGFAEHDNPIVRVRNA